MLQVNLEETDNDYFVLKIDDAKLPKID